jgi:DNA-binding CsgD family transcriptional regulator
VVIIAEFAAQPTADSPLQAPAATSNPLIQYEQDVLELLTRLLSNQEIADRFFRTIRNPFKLKGKF